MAVYSIFQVYSFTKVITFLVSICQVSLSVKVSIYERLATEIYRVRSQPVYDRQIVQPEA